jgi:glyceraldehyde 3-phosphate dehydrogenase
MALRVGINGFGRIGRNAARILLMKPDTVLAAINSSSDVASHAYLLAHDSVYGPFTKSLEGVSIYQEKNPSDIPWGDLDIVLECTGKFTTTEDASKHAVKKVIISAPAKDDTPTYVIGVNHTSYQDERVVSNSSCTTNCLSTVLKVLDDTFGVVCGSMTTVHAATDSQNLLDNSQKKGIRDRRSALINLIPATSGSAKDIGKLFPRLAGLLSCRAIRVPTPTVSLIELVVEVKKFTNVEDVNAAFVKASGNILTVASEELVSTDYIGSPYSSIVDPFLTDVINGTFIHVTAWYDNEWGYANRLVELASYVNS